MQTSEVSTTKAARRSQHGFLVRVAALGVVTLTPMVALGEAPAEKAEAKRSAVDEEGEALWEAELRLGYGVMNRGTEMGAAMGVSPLSIEASGSVAISEEPHVMGYAGLVAEMLERSGVGVTAGARVKVPGMPMRVGGGGTWMFAPTTLWGAQASIGSCFGQGALGLCGDVQITSFFAGSGLPNDETELQVQFVLGVVVRGERQ